MEEEKIDRLLESVAVLMAKIIDKPKVDPDSNFFDLGGTSIELLKFISHLYHELNISVDPAKFFNNPSPLGVIAQGFSNTSTADSVDKQASEDVDALIVKLDGLTNARCLNDDLLSLIFTGLLPPVQSVLVSDIPESINLAEHDISINQPLVNMLIESPLGTVAQICVPFGAESEVVTREEKQAMLDKAVKLCAGLDAEKIVFNQALEKYADSAELSVPAISYIPKTVIEAIQSVISESNQSIRYPNKSQFFLRYPELIDDVLIIEGKNDRKSSLSVSISAREIALLIYRELRDKDCYDSGQVQASIHDILVSNGFL